MRTEFISNLPQIPKRFALTKPKEEMAPVHIFLRPKSSSPNENYGFREPKLWEGLSPTLHSWQRARQSRAGWRGSVNKGAFIPHPNQLQAAVPAVSKDLPDFLSAIQKRSFKWQGARAGGLQQPEAPSSYSPGTGVTFPPIHPHPFPPLEPYIFFILERRYLRSTV